MPSWAMLLPLALLGVGSALPLFATVRRRAEGNTARWALASANEPVPRTAT